MTTSATPGSARKIVFTRPFANSLGDEMTRVIWELIEQQLIWPFIDGPVEVFDLSIQNRNATSDQVTVDAANALLRLKCGVKCATITPDEARVAEFGLKKMWKSPNGTKRNLVGGAIYRAPIICGLPLYLPRWTKPYYVCRHAVNDMYGCPNVKVAGGNRVKLVIEPLAGGEPQTITVAEFPDGKPGVTLAMFNRTEDIESYARSCMELALKKGMPLIFSTKNTILKEYDGEFKDTFQRIFDTEFKDRFTTAGITYCHMLIDATVAEIVKGDGGVVVAFKNYDGDVMSDLVAQGFGSLGMMTSVLEAEGDVLEAEAAHGTVTAHWRKHQKGEQTSTNSIASIFAWSGCLRHLAKLEGNTQLGQFADLLEAATLDAVKGGTMTSDLARLYGSEQGFVTTQEFIAEVARRLQQSFAAQFAE